MILFACSASWFLVPGFLHRFLFEPGFTFSFFRLNKCNERLSLAKLQPTRTLVVVCYSKYPLDSGRVPGPMPEALSNTPLSQDNIFTRARAGLLFSNPIG